MTTDSRPPAEWAALAGLRVHDPDGWRDGAGEHGPKDWAVPITRAEFAARVAASTVSAVPPEVPRAAASATRPRPAWFGPKPDEIKLWALVAAGARPRRAGQQLGMHWRRVNALCEKWSRKRIYDYGVAIDLGWALAAPRGHPRVI